MNLLEDSGFTWKIGLAIYSVSFTILEILLGYIHVDKLHFYAMNYIILYGKYFINKQKRSQKEIYWDHFCRAPKI